MPGVDSLLRMLIENAADELRLASDQAPRMLKRGAYSQAPFDFAPYTPASPDKRVPQHVAKPTSIWHGRV